jgi:hypothetical protein
VSQKFISKAMKKRGLRKLTTRDFNILCDVVALGGVTKSYVYAYHDERPWYHRNLLELKHLTEAQILERLRKIRPRVTYNDLASRMRQCGHSSAIAICAAAKLPIPTVRDSSRNYAFQLYLDDEEREALYSLMEAKRFKTPSEAVRHLVYRAGKEHYIEVKVTQGSHGEPAEAWLFVNGLSVASWPADAQVGDAELTGSEYAHELSRCLTIALSQGSPRG